MSRVVAIANQKGGVGKTTTAVNLGASLAVAEQRVLLVDLDPQGNASTGVGMSPGDEEVEGSYELLLGEVEAADVIYETEMPYMHVIAATQDLVGAERDLLQADDSATRLRDALEAVRDDYDFIVVDCPPSLGMLTINALTAADMVIVPLQFARR
jgi:chromosome partitioning protein